LRPTSRGYVRINAADARAHPAIRYNYLSTPEDQRVAVDSIRLTRRIVSAPALAKFVPEEFIPGGGAE
jgi:Choline dehydrogenase and related flavoproteins